MKKRGSKKSASKIKGAKMCCSTSSHCGGGIYGLGFIGAAVFYIQSATGFWNGILGILKAFVWPAILVYKLLGFLYGI